MKVFHVSECGTIDLFEPRTGGQGLAPDERAVWAVEEGKLAHYLLPRDCPLVCFVPVRAAVSHSLASDARCVVAIERAWFLRAQTCRLFLYELPPEPFNMRDKTAGYWTSPNAVRPVCMTEIGNPLAALLETGAELRVLPSLWPLHDAVINQRRSFP
jgi:Family of unknown function (DUF6886)